jgi:hypothetical protein
VTNSEVSSDYIDPVAGGFILNSVSSHVNAAGGTFIYYAIA